MLASLARATQLTRAAQLTRTATQLTRRAAPTLLQARNVTQASVARNTNIGVSDDELKSMLAQHLQSKSRTELLDMLHGVASSSASEDARVRVFESVSPSVAYVSTAVDQPSSMWNGMPVGAGSGFVWDSSGYVVTNYHVIAGGRSRHRGKSGGKLPRKVMVKLQDHESSLEATVVGYEADKDLAVLKVDASELSTPLQPVELAASKDIRVGQSVLAIGAPFGLDRTLTSGIVSALGRDIHGAGGRPIRDCIQTDAAINPGNSGGPLLDSQGRLLGVNTMIVAPGRMGGNVGIGFAVPSDTVTRVVRQIIAHGPNARPSLGISVLSDQVRAQYARVLNREIDGAIIAEVVPGGPAEELSLKAFRPDSRGNGVVLGDVITKINGKPVKHNEDLLCAVEEADVHEPLSLTIMRECDDERLEEASITPVRRHTLMASLDEMEERVVSERMRSGVDQRMRKDW